MRILRKPEVEEKTGLSGQTIWRKERAGQFPRRHKISPNRVAWLLSEIKSWQRERAEAA